MKPDALRGHLDAMILAILESEPRHGYAIMEALQVRSDGALYLPTGTLYPALRRLERAGHLCSEWSTVSGRSRRTYQLTEAGRQALAAERTHWRTLSELMDGVLWPASRS